MTSSNRAVRLGSAHLTVLGGGVVTYLVGRRLLGLDVNRIAAGAGCFIAAGLVFGMLLDGSAGGRSAGVQRAALLSATLVLTSVLAVLLGAIARPLHLVQVSTDDWVEHASLNALATSIILHVAVGRRWPFVPPDQAADPGRTGPPR